MGTGQSKNSPDVQMRMKMENGFNEDDEDLEPFNRSDRDKSVRSKSNLSFHTAERFQNEDEEYFNKIYNKKSDKSMSSLNGSSIGVKSAPVGSKKEKDPEVAAAIAELEETFKVLGDEPLSNSNANGESQAMNANEDDNSSINESTSLESPSPPPDDDFEHSTYNNDLPQDLAPASGQNNMGGHISHVPDRQSLSRICNFNNELVDHGNFQRRHSRILDTRTAGSNGLHSSSGSSAQITMNSRGSDQRNFTLPTHATFKRVKNPNTQSILMQQRREFHGGRQGGVSSNGSISPNMSAKTEGDFSQEDWTYEPPKIDGFDVTKFKEINSKETQSMLVPLILGEEEDKGYYSRSPDIPSYTKDELELIASLERDVY